MKSAYFGWETDSILNATCRSIVPVTQPIILTGADLDLSLGFIQGAPPIIGDSEEYTEVLFSAYAGLSNATELGTVVFVDQAGKNSNLHGNTTPAGNYFAVAILKSWERSTVNKLVSVRGLSIPLSVGEFITLQVAHAGLIADFECQAILYYEQAGNSQTSS